LYYLYEREHCRVLPACPVCPSKAQHIARARFPAGTPRRRRALPQRSSTSGQKAAAPPRTTAASQRKLQRLLRRRRRPRIRRKHWTASEELAESAAGQASQAERSGTWVQGLEQGVPCSNAVLRLCAYTGKVLGSMKLLACGSSSVPTSVSCGHRGHRLRAVA